MKPGIVLQGWEVKSLRQHHLSLQGAFCTFKNHELFLNNVTISQYMAVSADYDRARKLLLKKAQLKRLEVKMQDQGLVLIPLKVYFQSKSLIKVEIALAKALKKHDKRQILKEAEMKKRLAKAIKNYS